MRIIYIFDLEILFRCVCLPGKDESKGIRISLRPLLMRDSDEIFAGMRHGDLLPAVPGSDQVRNPDDAARMVAGLMERVEGGSELHLSVCLEGGRVIGMCALYDFMPDHSARIGYWINKDHRRQGYGREAVGQLVSIAFADLGIRKVIAVSKASNEASLRLLRSLGFKDDECPGVGGDEKALSLAGGRRKGSNFYTHTG